MTNNQAFAALIVVYAVQSATLWYYIDRRLSAIEARLAALAERISALEQKIK